MAGLEDVVGEDESKKAEFSVSDIEQEWEQTVEKSQSRWMMGIYGLEGTAKSGVAMDIRSPEEEKEGVKVAIIDIDNSCRPLWEQCHDFDPNIRIFDPVVAPGSGTEREVDYTASYNKVIAILGWLEDNIEERNIGYVVVDGIDTFLKWCEHVMKEEDIGNPDIENQDIGYDWGKRNKRYYRVIDALKSLPTASIVTAHMSKDTYFEENSKGQKVMKTEVAGANWHRGKQQDTADELYQIVYMRKHEDKSGSFKNLRFTATVQKWKGDIRMEGREFLVLENKVDTANNEAVKTEWHGLREKLDKFLEKDKQEALKDKQSSEQEKEISGDDLIDNSSDEEDEEIEQDETEELLETEDEDKEEEIEEISDEDIEERDSIEDKLGMTDDDEETATLEEDENDDAEEESDSSDEDDGDEAKDEDDWFSDV